MYDYLIVGAGLYGAVFAYEMKKRGKTCLVIEKRNHIGGNIYTREEEGIQVHHYGAHIFHTNNKKVWEFVNSLVEFNRYTNSPVANYNGELYNLPFNMNTFYQMWGVRTPAEAAAKINMSIGGAVCENCPGEVVPGGFLEDIRRILSTPSKDMTAFLMESGYDFVQFCSKWLTQSLLVQPKSLKVMHSIIKK